MAARHSNHYTNETRVNTIFMVVMGLASLVGKFTLIVVKKWINILIYKAREFLKTMTTLFMGHSHIPLVVRKIKVYKVSNSFMLSGGQKVRLAKSM